MACSRSPRPFLASVLAVAVLGLLPLAVPAATTVFFGTNGAEILTGTDGPDGLTGKGGNDTLLGLAGNDTYFFADGWGDDLLQEKPTYRVDGQRLPGGTDTLSFRGVGTAAVDVNLVREWRSVDPGSNSASTSGGPHPVSNLNLGGSVVENVVGGRLQDDFLRGGSDRNVLAPGGGTRDELRDYGGWRDGALGYPGLPASDDTYRGFAANTGPNYVADWGGAADVLDLRPFRLDEVYLDRVDLDANGTLESLQVVTGVGGDGQVLVWGHFGPYLNFTADAGQQGRIETLLLADGPVVIDGGEGARAASSALGRTDSPRQRALAAKAGELAREAGRHAAELPGEPARR